METSTRSGNDEIKLPQYASFLSARALILDYDGSLTKNEEVVKIA